jgi:hypothetical protein
MHLEVRVDEGVIDAISMPTIERTPTVFATEGVR